MLQARLKRWIAGIGGGDALGTISTEPTAMTAVRHLIVEGSSPMRIAAPSKASIFPDCG
jgi:hypothetical protein